ncbi:MAG: twin-arginine translocation signal domain-containing protein [Myxococcales bacterium]|nr:twin-arginine translocation signal domain-containing protein [Myxococcales bacterium]
MVDQKLKNLRGDSRRKFLKFASAAGAALALDRSKVLDVIADSGGDAMADEAACAATNNSISMVAGNGGFAWFQLLWPHVDVAKAGNNNFAFHAPGQITDAPDTDKPFVNGPETPWVDLDSTKRITAFMAGSNETHTAQPTSAASVGNSSMLAAVASMQNALPSLLPVIGVTPFSFGNAPGAPAVTTVGSAEGMVDLFDSSASRALLSIEDDAATYEAYYKAFLSLNKAAKRPTWAAQARITKASANFLGKNLASELRPSAADETFYGLDGAPNNLRDLGLGVITAVKAFRLGLTNSVILPALRDDPHGAFGNMGDLQNRIGILGRIFDALMEDLAATASPHCSGKTLADTTIITVHGDTPKTPLNRSGWPDGTPNNSNWLYVMGNGYLKTGWFGGIRANGNTDGFDPATGDTVANQHSNVTTAAAGAAVLFAIAQGDMRRVEDFYNGPSIAGIVNQQIL